jgi:seryl-tRNA synthetase
MGVAHSEYSDDRAHAAREDLQTTETTEIVEHVNAQRDELTKHMGELRDIIERRLMTGAHDDSAQELEHVGELENFASDDDAELGAQLGVAYRGQDYVVTVTPA